MCGYPPNAPAFASPAPPPFTSPPSPSPLPPPSPTPPTEARVRSLTFAIEVEGTIESFDAANATVALAALLPGISPQYFQLAVAAGSLLITATISPPTDAIGRQVALALQNISSFSLSSALDQSVGSVALCSLCLGSGCVECGRAELLPVIDEAPSAPPSAPAPPRPPEPSRPPAPAPPGVVGSNTQAISTCIDAASGGNAALLVWAVLATVAACGGCVALATGKLRRSRVGDITHDPRYAPGATMRKPARILPNSSSNGSLRASPHKSLPECASPNSTARTRSPSPVFLDEEPPYRRPSPPPVVPSPPLPPWQAPPAPPAPLAPLAPLAPQAHSVQPPPLLPACRARPPKDEQLAYRPPPAFEPRAFRPPPPLEQPAHRKPPPLPRVAAQQRSVDANALQLELQPSLPYALESKAVAAPSGPGTLTFIAPREVDSGLTMVPIDRVVLPPLSRCDSRPSVPEIIRRAREPKAEPGQRQRRLERRLNHSSSPNGQTLRRPQT